MDGIAVEFSSEAHLKEVVNDAKPLTAVSLSCPRAEFHSTIWSPHSVSSVLGIWP